MLASLLFLTVTLATEPPEAATFKQAVAELQKPKQTTPDNFRRLFLAMWAQVPNWKAADPMWIRMPEPPWTPPPRVKGQPRPKRPPPHDPETLDWLAALRTVDLDAAAQLDPLTAIPPPPPPPRGVKAPPPPPPPAPTAPATRAEMETARAEAIATVTAMRALAATRRLDAVDPIFKVAFELDGVFRDECGRAIRSMESFAVPSLIRLMHAQDKGMLPKMRRYASYQLDRMDRQRPQKAIATAPDDRVRAEIIHAYGEARALDAVEAILGQVDAPSHRVRREARWAWLRYVTGKAPPPAPKRKRRLPGGKEEAEEKPDYLTYREIATLALQKQLAAIKNEPVDQNATAAAMTDELFAYYDQKRAAEWDGEFAAARAREAAGDLAGATDAYGWILAHDPNYARRGEMAPAFLRYGDRLRDEGAIPRALGYWRQAIDLAPDGPDAPRAAARVAAWDATEALARGHADVGAFRRALALDPSLDEARRGLHRARMLLWRQRALRVVEALALAALLALVLWRLWKRADRPTAV